MAVCVSVAITHYFKVLILQKYFKNPTVNQQNVHSTIVVMLVTFVVAGGILEGIMKML